MQDTAQTNSVATITDPTVGYHTLKLLEGLRLSYHDAEKEIVKVQNLIRLYDYEKNSRIANLRKWQKQLKTDFNFWAELVKEWVSQFSDKDALYGDIIVEYYCDFYNIRSLKNVITEVLCEEDDKNKSTQNFQAKLRQITLNQIQKN